MLEYFQEVPGSNCGGFFSARAMTCWGVQSSYRDWRKSMPITFLAKVASSVKLWMPLVWFSSCRTVILVPSWPLPRTSPGR
ncbi:hypothetical protein SGLAM104S_08355 [Streptomyces glaucescens]